MPLNYLIAARKVYDLIFNECLILFINFTLKMIKISITKEVKKKYK